MTAEPVRAHEPDLPLRLPVRLVGMGVLVWLVIHQAHPAGSGRALAALLLIVAAAAACLAWVAGTAVGRPAVMRAGLAGIAVFGAALVPFAPIAIAFTGVAALGAGILFETRAAAVIASLGPLVAVIATAGASRPLWLAGDVAAASFGGLVLGTSRRAYRTRARQEAKLAVAREIHDVLAHSLGALAVQLEALDALLADGADAELTRAAVARSRSIVTSGLADTRRAVQAMREEPVALVDQLTRLAADGAVSFEFTGSARPVPPQAAWALYRAGQEALTNARKHASGATIRVRLDFSSSTTVLTVTNTAGASHELASTGAGVGLQGMRERIELVGGSVSAGPVADAWQVRVEVPA
jgi:signal transduction histidine kinase